MVAYDVLHELQRRGVEIVATGDCLRFRPRENVTPELHEKMTRHKAELINLLSLDTGEVDWRVDVMRPQVPVRGPIPFLIARPDTPQQGRCLSCGDPLTTAQRHRCAACLHAAHRVLYEVREDVR